MKFFEYFNEEYMYYVRDHFYEGVGDYYMLEVVIPTVTNRGKDNENGNTYIPKPEADTGNNRFFLHFTLNTLQDETM